MKFRYGALLLTALLSACGLNTSYGSHVTGSRNVHESAKNSFDLAANGTVRVENVAGIIDVQTWDRPRIEIAIDKYGEDKSDLANTNVVIDHGASDFAVKTEYRRENGFPTRGGAVDYHLRVPRTVTLTVENVSGPVIVSGVSGSVDISDVSGTVRATGLANDAKASTTSGRIELAFDKLGRGQSVSAKAISGRITITAPKNASATVDASTTAGTVTSDFASIHPERGEVGMKANGRIGNGDATLALNTVSGSITIRH